MKRQAEPFSQEYNCLTTDLVGGFPTEENEPIGATMYVWNATTKELESIFKRPFGVWYKL